MRIKTKITFGVGLLFLMILALASTSVWYIYQLKKDTNNILVANYNTILFSRNMAIALEDIPKDSAAISEFRENLIQQQKNVTELGEKEATALIAKHFKGIEQNPQNLEVISFLRRDLTQLQRLNMEAIERKSHIADQTAEKAILIISVAGSLCFVAAFVLLVNLPSNIANPIQELTDSIQEISDRNYQKRVNFKSNNEFANLAKSFNVMAEKLQEYSESKIEKILKGKKRIETLIDNLHDPVIGIDENKKVLFVNEEALKITGMKKEQFVGKQIVDLALNNDLIRGIVKDTLEQSNKKCKTKMLKIFADSKESYFEKEIININILPTGEMNRQFIGQVIMLRNITPFKELDLAKTNFMGTVSHEFKTPIASIQMGIQLLENQRIGSLNKEQTELVLGIKEDTSRLLKITSELLNITQVESGSIQIKMSPTNLQPIIDYALNATKAAAENQAINIRLFNEVSVGQQVLADGEKTAWVLTNLLSNAIRYSYENASVDLHIQTIDNQIKFSVVDTGQGIEKQYVDKIFERYFRIPGSQKEGTGLGLSISKEFIEAQGGELFVESELGAGSVFWFTLNKV